MTRSSSSPSSDTTPKLFFALEDSPVNTMCPRLRLKSNSYNLSSTGSSNNGVVEYYGDGGWDGGRGYGGRGQAMDVGMGVDAAGALGVGMGVVRISDPMVQSRQLPDWQKGPIELAYTMEVNERCDVYSFGVLTLELITGKHLGDLISSLSSSSSFSSSTSTVHGILLKDVLDQRLLPPKNQVAEQVVMVVKLSFACLQTNPLSRPTMRQVAMKISNDQSPPLRNQFHMITLGQL
ncbi:putative leucine-rich repeat receptor-like protein kinase [Camellia lanceoleosa]|uniref:Leucine-rich repeat receptor-like protein kinase n=1 Tax=Camellia lanceoleosa TaxID=1840588 RepID=A0ACC0GQ75_9ERIC|nr:putative leucine-rich repeat receptor-like protein kinase [Camellia lanceoleosa]